MEGLLKNRIIFYCRMFKGNKLLINNNSQRQFKIKLNITIKKILTKSKKLVK